jgi:excisionase family DNA binding protein
MIAMIDKNWVTVKDAAEIIGCSNGHIRHLIDDDKLVAKKFGNCWAIERKTAEKVARTPAKTGRPRKVQKN